MAADYLLFRHLALFLAFISAYDKLIIFSVFRQHSHLLFLIML
nr:MAG TPA: hypothetical protein [Caudoviricetes sp.]